MSYVKHDKIDLKLTSDIFYFIYKNKIQRLQNKPRERCQNFFFK